MSIVKSIQLINIKSLLVKRVAYKKGARKSLIV
jgi:hypothetical protein